MVFTSQFLCQFVNTLIYKEIFLDACFFAGEIPDFGKGFRYSHSHYWNGYFTL